MRILLHQQWHIKTYLRVLGVPGFLLLGDNFISTCLLPELGFVFPNCNIKNYITAYAGRPTIRFSAKHKNSHHRENVAARNLKAILVEKNNQIHMTLCRINSSPVVYAVLCVCK